MPEYTYDDIIVNPYSEKARSCIGKEVYYSYNLYECLSYANNSDDNFCGILREIKTGDRNPFTIEDGGMTWACIIPKKVEMKPRYVPFESAEEFLDAYFNTESRSKISTKKVSGWGIWLKRKCNGIWISQCTDISDHGIALGLDRKFMVWRELLDGYEFINGTPCGKLMRG